MSIEIRSFRHSDKKNFKVFLKVSHWLYRDDPNWVPEFLMERQDFHNPKRSVRKTQDITYFVAFKDGQPVGRITAHSYPAHNAFWEDKVGFFGFFECIDDADVAAALFDAAAARLREMGFDTMRGPCNYTTNEEVGTLVWDSIGESPNVMMTYNPLYHAGLYERAGFAKAKDLLAFQVTQEPWPIDKIVRMSKLVQRKYGATLRSMRTDKKNWPTERATIRDLYERAWEKNWGFVPLTVEEFEHQANELRMIAYPRFNLVIEVDGKVVGWALTLPDIHEILKHTRGKALPTIYHMLIRKSQFKWKPIVTRARIAALGLLPEWRKRGLEAMFYERVFEVSIHEIDIPRGEMSWILEDNAEMVNGAKMMQAVHYKTYRIYDRAL